MAKNLDPLIVIVGETASGKSALALELAEKFGGEIICADSWTVYKNFDIGTAKPSASDQAKIPHHLLDIADPAQGFSAAIFKDLALAKISEISSRGKLPFLVGGSGLYIDAVIYDYGFLPAPNKQLREQLNSLCIVELLNKAASQNLDTSQIDVRNRRRIIRLIENNGSLPTRQNLRPNTLILGLTLADQGLQSKIAERVEIMIKNGLEQEARQLSNRYGWEAEPIKGIGYREWQPYFKAQATLDETKRKIIKSTMELAKKQRTWFKRNKSIQWVDEKREAVEIITAFLNK
ncbi:MAG: tRNA (adenosine(37)-N6)-dimethylallyltransferase MiaA [Candidatus Saccharimonadales bacterium]